VERLDGAGNVIDRSEPAAATRFRKKRGDN